jgi:outer membrane lipoprotein-sorting protein
MNWSVWLVVSTVAWAGQSLTTADLRTALAKYQGMESLDVTFKQTKTLKDMDFTVESEGRMFIQMPDLVRWQMTKPSAVKVELNRDQITVESSGKSNKVDTAAIPPAQRREFLNMFNWLKLDADAIAATYDVSRLGPNQYAFNSRSPDSMFKTLEMQMSKNGHVESMRFKEKSDDEIVLRFGSPKMKYAKKK